MSEAAAECPSQHPGLASGTMGTPLSEIQRDPDVWFDDGNVIVIAQRTAFRFHRGTLAQHSEIFRSLFSIPQPTSPDTMDGCPVICVTDTPYDFKFLLRAIYDGVRYARIGSTAMIPSNLDHSPVSSRQRVL